MASNPRVPGPETTGRLDRMPADTRAPASRERDEARVEDQVAERAELRPARRGNRARLSIGTGWWAFAAVVVAALVIYFAWNY